MHFSIEQEDATTIFRLKEPRLDSQNAGQLKAEFLILAQADVETLIVDLHEVNYIDSAGLSSLLLAERQQSAHGGDIRLVGLNESVRSLLRLTQLDRVLPVYDTLDEALDAEPSFGDDDDDDGPSEEAPTAHALRTGDLAAGGSLGAAAMASIMMGVSQAHSPSVYAQLDEDEEFDDDDFDDDDEEDDDLDDDELDDDELDEDDDDLEEESIGGTAPAEATEETASETTEETEATEEDEFADAEEDDEFEDDDFDEEELEEDDEEDF